MNATEKQTHTPGPWAVVDEYDGARTIAIMRDFSSRNNVGLHVTADHDWVHSPFAFDQIFANARLIAAAPDLLAACRAVLADGFLDRPSLNACRAAIAKAEGRA